MKYLCWCPYPFSPCVSAHICSLLTVIKMISFIEILSWPFQDSHTTRISTAWRLYQSDQTPERIQTKRAPSCPCFCFLLLYLPRQSMAEFLAYDMSILVIKCIVPSYSIGVCSIYNVVVKKIKISKCLCAHYQRTGQNVYIPQEGK